MYTKFKNGRDVLRRSIVRLLSQFSFFPIDFYCMEYFLDIDPTAQTGPKPLDYGESNVNTVELKSHFNSYQSTF